MACEQALRGLGVSCWLLGSLDVSAESSLSFSFLLSPLRPVVMHTAAINLSRSRRWRGLFGDAAGKVAGVEACACGTAGPPEEEGRALEAAFYGGDHRGR